MSFAAPLVLAALVALPAIWLLLRVTPPQPRLIAFPPLKIIRDLAPRRETPARTPWWLLALRLLIAAALILAAAGPILNPPPAIEGDADAPVLLLVDNGALAAGDWRRRADVLVEQGEALAREGRSLGIVATAEPVAEIPLLTPAAALERLRAIRPAPHLAARAATLPAIEAFVAAHPDAQVVWLSDGVSGPDEAGFAGDLADVLGDRSVIVFGETRAPARALAGTDNTAAGLVATLVRAEPNGRDAGVLRAVDLRGLPVGETPFAFEPGATEATARFDLPIELRNAIARVEISGEGSAAAVSLVDERSQRRRVGIVSGASLDQAQPLLAPTFYIERALAPFAEVREARGSASEGVERMLDDGVSVLVLADVGALEPAIADRVEEFVANGGLLLRFAGPRLSAGSDDLVPVRLRRGGRTLGGALSWDTPRTLAPFTRESPFQGLAVPDDLGVRRQILAEPDATLPERTWAALDDGTPIVTAERRGDGLVVLFHVTADASWSNLPLTGLFVDMLRRTIAFSAAPASTQAQGGAESGPPVAPRQVLDGFGAFVSPPPNAMPVTRAFAGRAEPEHPPGFYGPVDSALAVNALVPGDRLAPVDLTPLDAERAPLEPAETVDLRAPLLTAALVLLMLDTLASLWLGGHLGRLAGRVTGRARGSGAAAAIALAAIGLLAAPEIARAQSSAADDLPPLSREVLEGAFETRLAYVITGDDRVDETSRAGLDGLSRALARRTALEPGDPVGVDPERDELAFFPLVYWPITPDQPLPSLEAIRALDAYMKNGGTVIFDTRDALTARASGAPTPETAYLRSMLATLDIPPLEPLPADHVITKTFYILRELPGRFDRSETWVEAMPDASPDGIVRPARSGDGVSPIIITGNDLAAAWAIGPGGEAMYPVSGSDPRQREMAYRAGINIVMYTLTGNYKADQVHVPALLERLGN
ncbi:DUF4159 domain-containing protein [Salinarimonas ramus]|uniref:LytTR family transcriptional regulator n=1 Tax=Salinarimonas ramus TaxID=690164 RepID=A0A917V4T1_9HYPH|nr:DUF4159 domain-containing protein [Salinarimonas ramus]GGK37374.1 LytTR family transcriptional regulator [Salinarimonas ramus]